MRQNILLNNSIAGAQVSYFAFMQARFASYYYRTHFCGIRPAIRP